MVFKLIAASLTNSYSINRLTNSERGSSSLSSVSGLGTNILDSLLLLDEPSLGLAPIIVKQIFETIKRINKENDTTILLVEQNAFGALKLSDSGYVLVNGKVTISGESKQLLENPEIKKAYLEGV